MRCSHFLPGLLVAAASFTLVAAAFAQQMGDDADGEVPKRVDRAVRIVDALEAAKKRAYEAESLDATYVQQLDRALEDARAMTKPVTADELTEAEQEALAEELGAADPAAERRQEWQDRALSTAFEDTGLSEEEEAAATPIVSEWYAGFLAARRERDSKKQSDLKNDRDDALRKLLGRKKANKVINNLNSLSGWGRGR